MDWQFTALIIFGLVFVLLFIGIPVAVALGLTGVFTAVFFLGKLGMTAYAPWQVCNSFMMTALPLFILMGQILLHGGLGERLYDGSAALVGRFPGGLLHANIFSCAIFAAVSGSSVATAATIGTIAIPELEKRGYDGKMIIGSIGGGGTLGMLIPPSIPLIIYGVLVEQSIGQLFIAGIIPGIMLAGIFMIYIWVRAKINPSLAPPYEKMPLKRKILLASRMWPVGLLIFIILGGIYLGVMTPTEAAAAAAMVALIITLGYRKMTWRKLQQCLLGTVKTNTMVLFIVIGANIVAGQLGLLRVPAEMAEWVTSLGLPPIVILLFVYILYLILGCLLEAVSMLVLTMPVIFPVMMSLGFDPIWFGIALVILIEMAQITPPVGLNLYTLKGICPNRPITEIIFGCMPFFLLMIVFLGILTAFPIIATWLPSTMRG